jgi:hypothetical protein
MRMPAHTLFPLLIPVLVLCNVWQYLLAAACGATFSLMGVRLFTVRGGRLRWALAARLYVALTFFLPVTLHYGWRCSAAAAIRGGF